MAAPRASFRTEFNCLWCGRPHRVRGADDIEGFALLCPDCVGRAQDNEFLRFRLREGLRARSAASSRPAVTAADATAEDTAEMAEYYSARAAEYDDYFTGSGWPPLQRAVFLADLDAATLWLDGLPWKGEIVELAAGTGWWSPLLAQKGELSLYDIAEPVLDRARERLLAHGLRAHIHVRDAWAEPDRRVDGLFTGLWLSHVARDRLPDFLGLARRWLKPGGTYAFVDEAPGLDYTPSVDHRQARQLESGRQFVIPKTYYEPDELAEALHEAGFNDASVTTTSRFFLLGQAHRASE